MPSTSVPIDAARADLLDRITVLEIKSFCHGERAAMTTCSSPRCSTRRWNVSP
jgi:hypothetical protein